MTIRALRFSATIFAALALAAIGGTAAAGAQDAATAPPVASPPAPVEAAAVFKPPDGFLAKFHKACDARKGASFSDCFVEQMRKAGASAPALEFARRVEGQGYLRAFQEWGRVDMAFVEYPFRANENSLCFLVNGKPPLLDVDALSEADLAALVANRQYAEIAKAYPKVAVFPGPRRGQRSPRGHGMTNGGQSFVVPYVLKDGCHACKRVGEVMLSLQFDVEGRYTGVQVLRVRPLVR